MKKIYLVATFRKIDAKYGVEGSRTVGWFPTKKDAMKCVLENWGDIYEDGWYPYAVIEDVQPGLYMSCAKHTENTNKRDKETLTLSPQVTPSDEKF